MGRGLGSRLIKPQAQSPALGVSMLCPWYLWAHQDTQGWRLSIAKATGLSVLVRSSSINAVSQYLVMGKSPLKIYYVEKKITQGLFIFSRQGGWWNFLNPHYELLWPPHSVLFFSQAPPTDGHFLGGTPPFKRDIMIIKPDMHIFCSVQYDLYFLFNVKLLTTHSTDVAATNNSKNKFCPFAKALLHYFLHVNIKKIQRIKTKKSQFPIFRGTQRQFSENICSEDALRSRIFGTFVVKFLACWPLLGFSNIKKMV